MITYVTGNLLDSDVDVMVHGQNCKWSFSGGIAQQIARKFPMATTADLQTLWGDAYKLGTYTVAERSPNKYIVNAYTQFNYTLDKDDVDYSALRMVMKRINNDFPSPLTIGMPKIGAGAAGGNWHEIEWIINDAFGQREIFVYVINKEVKL